MRVVSPSHLDVPGAAPPGPDVLGLGPQGQVGPCAEIGAQPGAQDHVEEGPGGPPQTQERLGGGGAGVEPQN